MTFRGAKNRHLTVISTYQVCDAKTSGVTTIYKQQVRYLTTKGHFNPNPRDLLLSDLLEFIQKKHKEDHQVVLMLDTNDSLRTPNNKPSKLQKFIHAAGLCHCMKEAYPDTILPITQKESSRCIDHILMSASLISSIRACGALPLLSGIRTDHRLLFLDLVLSHLLGYFFPDPILAIPRVLKSSSIHRWANYKAILKAYYTTHIIYERAIEYTKNIATTTKTSKQQYWIKKFDDLDQEKTHLQLKAESKIGPVLINAPPWSPTLMRSHAVVRYWEARQTLHKLEEPMEESFIQNRRDLGIDDLELEGQDITTSNYIQDQVNAAKLKLEIAIKEAPQNRDQYLKDQGEYYESIGKGKAENIIKNIKRHEKIRRTHTKHGSILKPPRTGMLRYLLSPTPDGEWEHITNPVEMFHHLLHKNTHHLFKSHISIFAKGTLAEAIGPNGDNPIVEDILQRTYKLGTEYLKRTDYKELQSIIKALRVATTPSGERIPTIQAHYTQEVYQAGFKGTKEYIASSAQGLHMGHNKAASEDDFLSKTNAILVDTPFQYGFSLTRWEQLLHCMLQKKEKPWITKLRIIQLFEGDFNNGLKFFFSKTMI